jgi:magnesium chelatase family protein
MTGLINSGFSFTFGRTTINLVPADVKTEGPSFDLPIAIGMVAAAPDPMRNVAVAWAGKT